MRKSRAVRVAGFVGALGASAALVGFAATGTGAYFSDSHTGSINASTGSVKVNIAPGDGNLNFTNLLPGAYQDQQISYQSTGTGNEDVWLVFPTTGGSNPGGNPSEAFTGYSGDGGGGGLGRYGHLAINAPAGTFTSYNLNGRNPSDTVSQVCGVDANGHGGSNAQAASKNDPTLIPYCAAPTAILLSSNMAPGQLDSATITFGYTPLLTGPQAAALAPVASYKIVATQTGVRPDDPNVNS
jgi:hypothetical protein